VSGAAPALWTASRSTRTASGRLTGGGRWLLVNGERDVRNEDIHQGVLELLEGLEVVQTQVRGGWIGLSLLDPGLLAVERVLGLHPDLLDGGW
jgi:hypothetical protein